MCGDDSNDPEGNNNCKDNDGGGGGDHFSSVRGESEESFHETETSDLRLEYTGVCQAPQALGDNRSARRLDQTQTPIFFLCVDTCPSLSHAAQVQMVL